MNLASRIDHTLLRADCLQAEILNLCREAVEYNFSAVCVPPFYTKYAADYLKGHPVAISTVVGFPLGYQTVFVKLAEAKEAIDSGATEIDAVINISAVKNGDFTFVSGEIKQLTTLVHNYKTLVKVIIETAYLSKEEIKILCEICAEAKVDFVKTSTGFAGKGATIEDVLFMRSILPEEIKIKASGGIKTMDDAVKLVKAGADRLGTSNGLKIINEAASLSRTEVY